MADVYPKETEKEDLSFERKEKRYLLMEGKKTLWTYEFSRNEGAYAIFLSGVENPQKEAGVGP